jgi:outer membrane protein TolC
VLSTSVQAGPILNQASVTFPKGSFGEYGSTGPIPDRDTKIGIPRRIGGLSTSQFALPLTQQPRIGLGIRSADLETRTAAEQAEATVQQEAAQVGIVYFQTVALEAARATAASQVRVAEEVARLAQKGVAEGTGLPAERAEAESRLERARADAANLETDIRNGHEQLNLLMGEPLDAQFQLASRLPTLSALNLEEARARAAANRPEVREARLRLEQADLAIRSKRLEWIPDVSLTLTHYGFLNSGNLAPNQVAIAGLSLNWEPWDWGRKNRERAAGRQRREQARLALAQAEAQAGFEAGRAWRESEKAQRDLDAARQEVSSGAESLRVAQQRYDQQTALLRTVLEAQTAWESAGQREARAAAAAGAAWSNLQLAMGAEI